MKVHDGEGCTLFEGSALLSPGFLVRTRVDPVGMLVVAGPVSGSEFPPVVEDAVLDDMLGTGDLVATRMFATMPDAERAGNA